MDNLVSIDTILDWLKGAVEQKIPVDAHTWVDASQKLNVLLSDEHDLLFKMQQTVAKMRVANIESGMTVSAAKMRVEASDEYTDMCSQKARIGRIEEFIRIAKIQARLKDNEYRMQ